MAEVKSGGNGQNVPFPRGKGRFPMKQRSDFIDNLKGLLVFLVVAAHFLAETAGLSPVVNAVYIAIYAFHIPLFAFLSGYLSKSARARGTAVRSFLAMYIFAAAGFSLFSNVTLYAYAHMNTPPASLLRDVLGFLKDAVFAVFRAAGPSWFLLSLMTWRLVAPRAKSKRVLPFSVLAALLVGGVGEIGYALSLSRTVVFFPLFLAGYFFERESFEKRADMARRPVIWIPAAALFLSGLFALDRLGGAEYRMLYGFTPYADMGYGFLKGAAARLCLFVLAALASVCVLALVPRRRTFLARWGEQSMGVYILHIFLMPLVAIAKSALHIGLWFAPLSVLAAVAACQAFSMRWAGVFLSRVKAGLDRVLFGKAQEGIAPER
jgi:fucose 4-O-acetylase-like acetyltransferase